MKVSGVIGEGSDSFTIIEEFEAKKRGISCAVYFKFLKLTVKHVNWLFRNRPFLVKLQFSK